MAITLALGVTPSSLNDQAVHVEATVEEIEKQLATLQDVLSETRYWEGDAANLHRNDLSSRSQEIQAMLQRLRAYPVDIRKMAGVYEAGEQSNVATASQLKSDIPLK